MFAYIRIAFFYGALLSGWYGLYYLDKRYGIGVCIAAFFIFLFLMFLIRKLITVFDNYFLSRESSINEERKEIVDDEEIEQYHGNIMDDIYQDNKDSHDKYK